MDGNPKKPKLGEKKSLKRPVLTEQTRDESPVRKGNKKGRNKGHDYEAKIDEIIKSKGLRVLDVGECDTGFIHKKVNFLVEVKAINAPDFGQKYLKWSEESGWEWTPKDEITEIYDDMGLLKLIDSGFKPNLYTIKPIHSITPAQRLEDQRAFKKDNIEVAGLDALYRYYARRNCFYIQIENKGFFYLEKDIAGLGVPQFRPILKLRMRAKTVSSIPTYNYRFLVVLNADKRSVPKSGFDLEEKEGRKFPNIVK